MCVCPPSLPPWAAGRPVGSTPAPRLPAPAADAAHRGGPGEGAVGVRLFIGAGARQSAAIQSVPVYPGRRRANFRRTSSGTNLPATKWWRPEKRPAQRLGAASDTSTSGRSPSSASPPVSGSQPGGGRTGGGSRGWEGCSLSGEPPPTTHFPSPACAALALTRESWSDRPPVKPSVCLQPSFSSLLGCVSLPL